MRRDVKLLVIACNSIEVSAIGDIAVSADIPVVGVVNPGSRAAIRATRNGIVGVIGTEATIATGAYQRAIGSAVTLHTVACPAFVDHVERGDTSSPELRAVARGYLEPLMEAGIDTLVLGCTHYPLLSGLLQLELGPDVVLVSSAEETAKDVYGELVSRELLAPAGGRPVHEFVTTGDPDRFQSLAEVFLGPEVRDLGVRAGDGGGRVELTVLGAQGTWPGAGGENCGYLLTQDGYHLQIDAGTGTFARLQQVVGVDDVEGMLITHGHPDHYVDIIPTFYARHYGRLGQSRSSLLVPRRVHRHRGGAGSENGRNVMAEAFDFLTAAPAKVFELGPFRITPSRCSTSGCFSLGYRIEAGGVVFAYTGDTGPCEAAIALGA